MPKKPVEFVTCLGEVLQGIREAYKLTKRDVAAVSGIDPSYVTLMEGKGNVPTRNLLARIAEGLDKLEVPKVTTQHLYWSARIVPPEIPADLLAKYARLSSLPIKEQNRILNQIK